MIRDQNETQVTRRTVLRRVGAVAAAGALPVAGTASATAATSSTQGILADGINIEPDQGAFIRGFISGITGRFTTYDDPETLAGRAQNEFNANTDAWVRYGNWLLDEADVTATGSAVVDVSVGVSRIPFIAGEDVVETHIVAEYDERAEQFVDLQWNDDLAEEADFQVGIRNQAAQSAPDELLTFRKRYIGDEEGEHEIPDGEYLSSLAGKYATTVSAGANSMNVLEILLGDLNAQ